MFRGLYIKDDVIRIETGYGDGLAGGKQYLTAMSLDNAAVLDIRCDQKDVTISTCLDVTHVLNRAGILPLEPEISVYEILIVHVQGRSNQSRSVNNSVLAKDDAIRVDDEDLSVGQQLSEDGRRELTGDPVEHGAGRVLLNKTRGFILLDRELLPVDDAGWRVRDFQYIGTDVIELHLATSDIGAGGIGVEGQLHRQAHDQREAE